MKITTRLIIYIISAVLVAFVALSGMDYYTSSQALRQAMISQEHYFLQTILVDYNKKIEHIVFLLDSIGNDSKFKLPSESDGIDNPTSYFLYDMVKANPIVDGISVMNSSGQVVASSRFRTTNVKDAPYFDKAMEGVVFWETPQLGLLSNKYVHLYLLPIWENYTVVGTFGASIDLDAITYLWRDYLEQGVPNRVFVLDNTGKLILDTADHSELGEDYSKYAFWNEMSNKTKGELVFCFPARNESFLFYEYLPDLGWYVVVSTDSDDVFASSNALLVRNAYITLLVMLLTALFLWRMFNNLFREIYSAAAEAALEIGETLQEDLDLNKNEVETIKGSIKNLLLRLKTDLKVAVAERTFTLEQKQIELEAMLNQAPAAVVIIDENDVLVYSNKATNLFSDVKKGDSFRVLFHSEEFYAEISSRLHNNHPFHSEIVTLYTPSEKVFHILTTSDIIEFDGMPCYLLWGIDITTMKQYEETLIRERALVNTVFNTIPDLLFYKDINGIYQGSNKAFQEFVGLSMEDIVGKTDYTIFHSQPEEMVSMLEADQFVLDNLSHLTLEETVFTADGVAIILETEKTVCLTPDGRVFGTVGVSRNITERNKREKDLELAKQKAEEATKAKSEFLARMSHEIRTPLNGIMGMTHLVALTELSNAQRHYVEKISTSANHLSAIINDILDFSKIEAGHLNLESIPFNIRRTVSVVFDNMQSVAVQKQLVFNINIDSAIPEILEGDPLRFSQILLNLISNAIKFTEKGVVTVEISQALPFPLLPKYSVNDMDYIEYISVLVQDTGIGMKQATLDKLFEEFTQADGSISRKYGGTGLGLAISRKLTGLMGGFIEVKSSLGKGTLFSVYLPFKRLKNIPVTSHDHVYDISLLKGKKVLLAEDNDINAEIAIELLQTMGLEVKHVVNGQAAIDEMKLNNHYDVILMDIQMPEVDGLAATKAIRALGIDKNIPIIAMTANAMSEDKIACMAAGMNDHIAKPIVPEILENTLISYLS